MSMHSDSTSVEFLHLTAVVIKETQQNHLDLGRV